MSAVVFWGTIFSPWDDFWSPGNRPTIRDRIGPVFQAKYGVINQIALLAHKAGLWLTLITGHARRETLAIYQHVALDGELEQRYQDAMKKVDL